jgi:hypothetical protein
VTAFGASCTFEHGSRVTVERMATIDRIEPAPQPWSPSAAGFRTVDEARYAGRHRRPGIRRLVALRLFYVGRHRRR